MRRGGGEGGEGGEAHVATAAVKVESTFPKRAAARHPAGAAVGCSGPLTCMVYDGSVAHWPSNAACEPSQATNLRSEGAESEEEDECGSGL